MRRRAQPPYKRANQWRRERRRSLNLRSKPLAKWSFDISDPAHLFCMLLRPIILAQFFPTPSGDCLSDPCRASLTGAPITKSSSVGGEICSLGRNDDDDDDKKRRSSFGAKMMGMVGLGKKSQSASQLNPEGQSQFSQ